MHDRHAFLQDFCMYVQLLQEDMPAQQQSVAAPIIWSKKPIVIWSIKKSHKRFMDALIKIKKLVQENLKPIKGKKWSRFFNTFWF